MTKRRSVDDEDLRGKNLHLSEIYKNITNRRRPEVVVNQYPERGPVRYEKEGKSF